MTDLCLAEPQEKISIKNYENDPLNATSLSDKYKKVLRSQVIDETHPGTILSDFKILLNFIGPNGIEVSKKNNFFREIPDQGLNIPKNNQQEQTINYSPGLSTVALLDLFGIISVRHGLPDEGKGWRITSVHRTPFGDALLQLMALSYRKNSSYFRLDVDKIEEVLGYCSRLFSHFFLNGKKLWSSGSLSSMMGYMSLKCLWALFGEGLLFQGTMTLKL